MLWSDGRLVEGGTLPFAMADRGLLLGDGVFDTALGVQGRVAFEAAHVDRLTAAAAALGFVVDRAPIIEAMRALAGTVPLAAIRTTLTRGPGPRGLAPPPEPAPLLFGSAAPARASLFFAPLRLTFTSIARNDTSPTARLKTLGYLDAVLAARDAQAQGFDEALFLHEGPRGLRRDRQSFRGFRGDARHTAAGGRRVAGHRPGRDSLEDRARPRPRGRGAPSPARRSGGRGGCVRHQLPAPARARVGARCAGL